MEHTPIPWKLDSKPTDYPQAVESSDGTVLAITGNDRANAAFIVRAANNHAKLLEALEAVVNEPISESVVSSDDCVWCSPMDLEEPGHEAWCPFFKARAVIEEARK